MLGSREAGMPGGRNAGMPGSEEARRLRSREASRIRLIIPEANRKVEGYQWLMIKVAMHRALPY